MNRAVAARSEVMQMLSINRRQLRSIRAPFVCFRVLFVVLGVIR